MKFFHINQENKNWGVYKLNLMTIYTNFLSLNVSNLILCKLQVRV